MNNCGKFPGTRLRRNRRHDWSRRLVAENSVSVNDLILPLFVQEGKNLYTKIPSMPSVGRLSIDLLLKEVKKAAALGIPAVAIFPVIDKAKKNERAKESYNPNNLVCRAVKSIKDLGLDIGIICDVALDPYTPHGHDGLLIDGYVENDSTVEILCKQAIAQAKSGCDVIAPSDMMDGRIGKIREALDSEGFSNTQILSYAAKYASSFYGPFREAVGSAKSLGKASKSTYQMDPANAREALREVALDIAEGADMVMIKPGMPYLDIIQMVSSKFDVPTLAYQVSGEYSMIKAASDSGWGDYSAMIMESMVSFKRAGACGVFTYGALDIAKILNN